MTNHTAAHAKAQARFDASPVVPLSADMMPYVLDAMIEVARKAKVGIAKMTEKQISIAIQQARETKIATPEPGDEDFVPGTKIPVAKAKAYARAYEAIDFDDEDLPAIEVVPDTPEPETFFIDEDEIPSTQPEPYTEIVREAAKAARSTRGSHASCTHDNTKVARAKCRRERAREAKA